MTDLNKLRSAFESNEYIKSIIQNFEWSEKFNNYQIKQSVINGDVFDLLEAKNDEQLLNGAWLGWQEKAKAQAVLRWISVKNAMPKAGSQVLTYDDYGFVSVENIDGCEDPNNVYFSHWLPLPPVEQEPTND